MAPVIHELQKQKMDFEVCVTAQHREMLDQVLDFFEIQPDYDLDLMKTDQSLNELSAAILQAADKLLRKVQPDMVLVHGDTTTSVMVAWAAFHRKIKVAHVEAGLRTYNRDSPFPEELNRQITAKLADIHFAPTQQAKENLEKERLNSSEIIVTGNTIIDALENAKSRLSNQSFKIESEFKINPDKKLILVTGHRRENFGKGFENLCEALKEIAKNSEVEIVYPVHLNPNVKNVVFEKLKNIQNIHLLKPVSYPKLLALIKASEFIISDSGGIQEEAPSFGKCVLVTREVSERMEGVKAGFSILVGTDALRIVEEAQNLLMNPRDLSSVPNPYGDGKAAERIVRFLKSYRV